MVIVFQYFIIFGITKPIYVPFRFNARTSDIILEKECMETDIFISYARKDWDLVKPFYERLTELGYEVWIDKDGIESGDAFKKVILKAIKSSRCLVFFSSENSNSSKWTAKEIGVAVKKEIPIIPVLFDKSDYNEEVEFDLVNLDYTDCSNQEEREQQLKRFLESIKKKLGNKTPQATVPIAEVSSSATCEIHFETDTPCDIYLFRKLVGHVEPDDDCILSLKPGRYKFEFVNSANSEHRYPLVYTVDNEKATDFIQIELSKNVPHKVKADSAPAETPKTKSTPRKTTTPQKKTSNTDNTKTKIIESTSTPPAETVSTPRIKPTKGNYSVLLSNRWPHWNAVDVLVKSLGYDTEYADTLVDSAPVNVLTNVSKSTATKLYEALTEAGVKAEIVKNEVAQTYSKVSTETPISQFSLNKTQTKKASSKTKTGSGTSVLKELLEDYTPWGQLSKGAKIVKKSIAGYLKKK